MRKQFQELKVVTVVTLSPPSFFLLLFFFPFGVPLNYFNNPRSFFSPVQIWTVNRQKTVKCFFLYFVHLTCMFFFDKILFRLLLLWFVILRTLYNSLNELNLVKFEYKSLRIEKVKEV